MTSCILPLSALPPAALPSTLCSVLCTPRQRGTWHTESGGRRGATCS